MRGERAGAGKGAERKGGRLEEKHKKEKYGNEKEKRDQEVRRG